MKKNEYDVIVIGGGPAGSTCATILADHGRNVLVLEKEKFPRHHIGESLIPNTYHQLKRIGMLDKMKASDFTKKFSVQFATASGRESRPFYFFETKHHESSVTWQVTRSRFDKMMLDNAREHGAEVREETAVEEVLFEGEQAVGVRIKTMAGAEETLRSKVIVDATGLTGFISSRLGIRKRDPKLKKAAVYSYWKGALRDPGIDEGATLVLRTPDGHGWFWYIPLENDVVSVGVVNDPDRLFKDRGRDHSLIYAEEIARCEQVQRRVRDAERSAELHTILDFSYRATRCAGPGWVLIGDAYAFLDPIYSSGVMLALASGEFAADSVHAAIEAGDLGADRLGAFSRKLDSGIESMRKLVYAYYKQDFSFAGFLRQHPDCRLNLIDLLVGDVFKDGIDDIYGPMKSHFEIPAPVHQYEAGSVLPVTAKVMESVS